LSKIPAASGGGSSSSRVFQAKQPSRNVEGFKVQQAQSVKPVDSNASKLLSVHKQQLEQMSNAKSSMLGAPPSSEWIFSQKEKRERLRARNIVYLDKLKHMVSLRDSQMENKIKQIQQTEQLRQEKARKASQDKEFKIKLKKEEN
jgi:hypothetical protein